MSEVIIYKLKILRLNEINVSTMDGLTHTFKSFSLNKYCIHDTNNEIKILLNDTRVILKFND